TTTDFLVTAQGGDVHYFNGGCDAVNVINISSTSSGGIGVVNGGEQGLLNVEFHPDYGTSNNYVFFYHTSTSSAVNSVSRMTVGFDGSDNLQLTDPVKIIDFRKPNNASNHNGGGLAFAPDDTLLASVGDGGSGGSANAQVSTNLMGSVIRIVPSLTVASGGYSIPTNNTFAAINPQCSNIATSTDPCPEILAIGLRNPYRMSIDGNIIYLGDVGSSYEEIDSFDYTDSSLNFGWDDYDGPVNQSGFRDPILAYMRNDSTADLFRSEDPACNGCATGSASIMIGDVYRGSGYGGELTGRLLHAEFMDAYMRGVSINSTGDTTDNGMHIIHHDGITAMIEGPDSYIYIATQRGAWGTGDADIVYRLVKP
ncbi:MAG: PQQ-dependent sugar dehydrogenase, partial [Gammaproteobacteria bacterium]|nr:PQQ-dependent sugar dehydrogenase [Gammaproteobacteria bacterium]